jgi:hypothetical protein
VDTLEKKPSALGKSAIDRKRELDMVVFTREVCHLEERMPKAAMAVLSSSCDDRFECFKEFHVKNILLLQISIMLMCLKRGPAAGNGVSAYPTDEDNRI